MTTFSLEYHLERIRYLIKNLNLAPSILKDVYRKITEFLEFKNQYALKFLVYHFTQIINSSAQNQIIQV